MTRDLLIDTALRILAAVSAAMMLHTVLTPIFGVHVSRATVMSLIVVVGVVDIAGSILMRCEDPKYRTKTLPFLNGLVWFLPRRYWFDL